MALLRRLVAVAAAALALTLAAPHPDRLLAAVRTATTPRELLVTLATAAGWAVLGWLIPVTALLAAAQLPGTAGRRARRALGAIAPRVATLAAGGALATSGLVSSAAADAPPPSLDWAAAPVAVTPASDPPPSAADTDHVVTAGESLWAIAAARLPADAAALEIAAEWQRWYATNRDVIGPDPGLIHPGQVLRAPAGAAGAQPEAVTS